MNGNVQKIIQLQLGQDEVSEWTLLVNKLNIFYSKGERERETISCKVILIIYRIVTMFVAENSFTIMKCDESTTNNLNEPHIILLLL